MPILPARLSAAWRALTAPGLKAAARHPVPLPGYAGSGYGHGLGWSALRFWGDGIADPAVPDDDGASDPLANPVVMAAVAWLARNFPVPDLRVVRHGGSRDGEPVEGHDLPKLLDRPNQIDDFYSFHERFVRTDLTCYDSFLLKRKTKSGNRVVDLWWLDPALVTVEPDPAGKAAVLGYTYDGPRGRVAYQTDEVVHVRNGSDPCNPLRGRGPLAGVGDSMAVVARGARYTGRVLRNGAATNLIISAGTPEFPINPEDVEYLRSWMRAAAAGDQAGTPLAVQGHLKVDRGGVSPRDMDLATLPDRAYADVAAAVGLPLMVLGFQDSQRTYSNYAESLRAAYHNALIPLQARYAEALGRGMPELVGPRERVEWDYSEVDALAEGQGEVVERLVKATAGAAILTVDEARESMGLGPMPVPAGPETPPETVPEAEVVEPEPEAEPEAPKAVAPAESKAEPADDAEARAALEALRALLEARGELDAWEAGTLPMAARLDALEALREQLRAELRAGAEEMVGRLAPPPEPDKALPAHYEAKLAEAARAAVAGWYRSALATVRRGILSGALLLLGPGPLPEPAADAVAEAQAAQDGYMRAFRDALADGTQAPDGTAVARAEMYGNSPWSGGQGAYRAAMAAAGATRERRVHRGADQPCATCREQVGRGWQPVGTLRAIGDSECVSNCHCIYEFDAGEGD